VTRGVHSRALNGAARSLLLMLIFGSGVQQTVAALRAPTLEDALAVKTIKAITSSPDARFLAVEGDGSILIISTDGRATVLAKISGSDPVWSPNGQMLAFDADVGGRRQLQVWYRESRGVERVTDMPDGVSPNPSYSLMGNNNLASWSPDSRKLAFSARILDYNKEESSANPKIRVFEKNASYTALMDGVFNSGSYDALNGFPGFDAKTMRLVADNPSRGLSKLFIADVEQKTVRQLTQADQHFFPAWSPDARTIAAIVDTTHGIEYPGPRHTILSLIDVASGSENRVDTPYAFNGHPSWSSDGRHIAIIAQSRMIGFGHIEIYSLSAHTWTPLATPGQRAALGVTWAADGHSLLLLVADRFTDSLWISSPSTKEDRQIVTDGGPFEAGHGSFVDQAATGQIFYVAEGATFKDRVFMRDVRKKGQSKLIYDRNPQLSELRLGDQRRVTWTNGSGDSVDGIVILPPDYRLGKRYPLIVDVYPGAARDRFNLMAIPRSMGQLEASEDYVVFLPGLRAPHRPSGFSRDEAYTEKARGAKGIPIMVDDFRSGVQHLVDLGLVDSDRVGIYGHSNGGYVANFLVTETNVAKCAVVSSGSSNDIYMRFMLPPGGWVDEISNGNIYEDVDEFIRMSPILRMQKVRTPLLLIVGDKDWNTWLPEMLMEFNALRQLGKDVTLVRYADEEHAFTKRGDIYDSLNRIHNFFDNHLMPHN
jgi:dipeptidyl aminopeptidase/acylaminoacyl peptidase